MPYRLTPSAGPSSDGKNSAVSEQRWGKLNSDLAAIEA
jgi:hypothetical protein